MFQLFGASHLAALALLAALSILIVRFGRQGAWLRRALAALLTGYVVAIYAQQGLAGELSWEYSLPLELCHWVLAACLLGLMRPRRLFFEIAYFWGLAGTVHALVTPDLGEDFPSWEFIQFFWAHGAILLTIAYFIAAEHFRPQRASVARMMAALNSYALVAGAFDLVFGWNYGYLRHPPARPSLLDYLGPWPWYLLSLELVALVSFWVLTLPWRRPEAKGPDGR